MTTKAYTGAGSALKYGTASTGPWTPVAQIKNIKPSGNKLKTVDITNLTSPTTTGGVVVDELMTTTIDPGTYDCNGVANPGDPTYLQLMTLQSAATLEWFQLLLPDGSTFVFQAYVTGFTPADVDVTKPIEYTFKLTVSGPTTFTQAGTGYTTQE